MKYKVTHHPEEFITYHMYTGEKTLVTKEEKWVVEVTVTFNGKDHRELQEVMEWTNIYPDHIKVQSTTMHKEYPNWIQRTTIVMKRRSEYMEFAMRWHA
mgnify:CR=1 FL=1